MTEITQPIVVTLREDQTAEQALEEEKLEKDLKLIEKIKKEEKAKNAETSKSNTKWLDNDAERNQHSPQSQIIS